MHGCYQIDRLDFKKWSRWCRRSGNYSIGSWMHFPVWWPREII